MPSARSLGWTGTGQTVAVIDTGVDRNHPWIGGHVVAEACFANPAVGVTGGICPNRTATQYGTGAAAPCTFTASTGSCGHGTHTAQTAAGSIFSDAASTFIRSRGTALRTLTSWTIGAWSTNRSFA